MFANIIEIATQRFCDRFVDYKIDPGRRLYDQMTQAARSIRANNSGIVRTITIVAEPVINKVILFI